MRNVSFRYPKETFDGAKVLKKCYAYWFITTFHPEFFVNAVFKCFMKISIKTWNWRFVWKTVSSVPGLRIWIVSRFQMCIWYWFNSTFKLNFSRTYRFGFFQRDPVAKHWTWKGAFVCGIFQVDLWNKIMRFRQITKVQKFLIHPGLQTHTSQ